MTEPIDNQAQRKSQQEGKSVEESIQVRIVDGDTSAALFIPKEVKSFPSLKQVHLAVENAGISYGIKDEVIKTVVSKEIKGKEVVFAEGKAPIAGVGSRIIWSTNTKAQGGPIDITDELTRDNPRLGLFSPVKKGQQILAKLPPTEGAQGMNIFGKAITSAGQDLGIPYGAGTYLSKDGLTLYAAEDGIASWTAGRVTVADVIHIPGNVDSQTGDIKVDGSLFIDGDVRSGFRVEAVGDIFVGGNIEGADVYTRSGSVKVKNGILGQSRAKILAGRNIQAGFIQDATVGAKQDVAVERYIINSAVTAGGYILAIKHEGIVRGGTLFAEKKIEVRVAGSDNRIETELKVGYTAPENISRARYLLRSDQRKNRMELAYVQKRLAFLSLLKERTGDLTEEKETQLSELEKKESILLRQHTDHSEKESELEQNVNPEAADEYEAESIRIHETIYQEASVAIGDIDMVMDKRRKNVLFFRVGDKLRFGPLREAVSRGHG